MLRHQGDYLVFNEEDGGDPYPISRAKFGPESTAMRPSYLVDAWQSDGIPAAYVPDVDDIVHRVSSSAAAGDIIMIMSNGGFGGIHDKLLTALKER